MAEEVKKAPKPVDPNSAKYKLGKIAADAYVDAIEAKKRGEKVAWVSSNFPVEIPETMGIATVYPENQAAGIAARGAGTRMCEVAESEGYSNDICAYARVSLAYAKLKSCPEQDVAMPDVLLCCSNICSCMIKWYENLARELNIPMILLDIPFNPDYEVSDAEVAYVTGQFWDAVKQLEEITGKKWSDEKFKEVTGFSCRSSRAWLAATGRAVYESVTDAEAMDALQLLCRTEGILPAIESAHALAGALRLGRAMALTDPDARPIIHLGATSCYVTDNADL